MHKGSRGQSFHCPVPRVPAGNKVASPPPPHPCLASNGDQMPHQCSRPGDCPCCICLPPYFILPICPHSLPLNPIGVLFLLTASIPAPRTGYTHYRDGRAPGYLREKERDGREGKRPSVFVIEERFRVLGPVQHLIINAGYVEHQPHHQGQTWGETKEKDGGKRFRDEVAEKLPSFRTLLAGESVKLWKCA